MAPQFVSGEATPAILAVGLGITLLVRGALAKVAASLATSSTRQSAGDK